MYIAPSNWVSNGGFEEEIAAAMVVFWMSEILEHNVQIECTVGMTDIYDVHCLSG